MGFTSKLYPGELIINDETPVEVLEETPDGCSKGLEFNRTAAVGAIAGAPVFPQELLIPRSEWQARIQEQEQRKTRVSDLITQAGLPFKDQDGLNYCWIFAVVHAIEILRVVMNQPMVKLSAVAVGAGVKGFRNIGGMGSEGLAYIVANGVPPESLWPGQALDRRYDTDATWEEAKNYKVTEWWDLQPHTLDELVSCLLRGIPVASARMWWAHETTDVEAAWIDGAIAVRGRNQWNVPPYNQNNGFFLLQGSRILADESVAPRVTHAS